MKSKPIRSPKHRKFVGTFDCCITKNGEHCNQTPADGHHLMKIGNRGTGRKEDDNWLVPLCRAHHREVTGYGDEREFWIKYNKPYAWVKELARHLASISPCEKIRLTIKEV